MNLVWLQGQGTSFWPGSQRRADGVQARDEVGVVAHGLEDLRTHPGHDPHGGDDVGGIGDLDAEHRLLGLDRTHAEGDDVHRPAAHRPVVVADHLGLHLVRVAPVVGGAGVGLVDRADERALFDPGDVGGVGARPERVRLLLLVEADEGTGIDERVGEPPPLVVRPVTPVDALRLGELGDAGDPAEQALVIRGGVAQVVLGGSGCGHSRDHLFARVAASALRHDRGRLNGVC